jgi:hypothetical protein
MNRDTKGSLQQKNAGESQGERGGYGNTSDKARESSTDGGSSAEDETPKMGMSKINEKGKGSGKR